MNHIILQHLILLFIIFYQEYLQARAIKKLLLDSQLIMILHMNTMMRILVKTTTKLYMLGFKHSNNFKEINSSLQENLMQVF